MPTYDYRCEACGHSLEIFHSMTSAPKRKCPSCGKLRLKRMIGSGAAIIFKGGGFYETDYRSESYKAGAKAEKESQEKAKEDSTAKKTETSSDTKSASKPKKETKSEKKTSD